MPGGEAMPVERFDGVLLHQQPLVATFLEGLEVVECDIRMVGQVHLRGRETAHPRQRVPAEHGRELLLPGAQVQRQIGHGRRRGHGMAPHRAQPLDVAAETMVAGDAAQPVEHVPAAHLGEPVQQLAGVIEHDARVVSMSHEVGDDVADAAVAIGEDAGVVHVAVVAAAHHRVEVADELGGAEVAMRRRDERLMHVQRHREDGAQMLEREVRLGQENRRTDAP